MLDGFGHDNWVGVTLIPGPSSGEGRGAFTKQKQVVKWGTLSQQASSCGRRKG